MFYTGKAVMYGGSFDIVTLGHLSVIKKAVSMFSKAIIVVADNPSKNPMFTLEQRANMMKEMVKAEFPNNNDIIVEVLPKGEYLASFANDKGCDILIRGIRDSLDLVHEANICKTNKMIAPNLETIYVMPEEHLNVVSSSWVKSLLGKRGWQKVVEKGVHPCVFKVLQEIELDKQIDEITNGLFSAMHISLERRELSVKNIKEIMVEYRNRPYHNYGHILDGLEVFSIFKEHWQKPDYVLLYAWLMHDINPDEDKSLSIALDIKNLPFIGKEYVGINVASKWDNATKKITELIMATKHNTCEYTTDDEQIFASVDLMNLGGTKSEYNHYNSLVCDEYREREKLEKGDKFNEDDYFNKWALGRKEFIVKFLNRKVIYPSGRPTFASREHNARENLVREMLSLQTYLDSREEK